MDCKLTVTLIFTFVVIAVALWALFRRGEPIATLIAFGVGTVMMSVSCTPAQSALEVRVVQEVFADFTAGMPLPQIEADVAKTVAGQPGADAVVLVNDALALLIHAGVVPAGSLPQANAMLLQSAAEITAKRAAKP